MAVLNSASVTGVTNINSTAANTPPVINDSAGTQIGTFCRAWVNFNGIGAISIGADFNVTSIGDNGVGDYTVNFTTAMPDTNFCVTGQPAGNADGNTIAMVWSTSVAGQDFVKTTSSVRLRSERSTNSDSRDADGCHVAIFR